jgi:hypothetical protein
LFTDSKVLSSAESIGSGHYIQDVLRSIWSTFLCVLILAAVLVHSGRLCFVVCPLGVELSSGSAFDAGSSSWEGASRAGRQHEPKRKFSQDDDSAESPRAKRKTMRPYRQAGEDERFYACHLWKLNPIRFADCLYRQTIRSDFLSHLKKHKQALHCPTCKLEFKKPEERDAHIVRQCCDVVVRVVEGVSEQSFQDISELPSGVHGEARWRAVWRILFPSITVPDSPYVGSEWDESMGVARRACQRFPTSMNSPYPTWAQLKALAAQYRDLSCLTSDDDHQIPAPGHAPHFQSGFTPPNANDIPTRNELPDPEGVDSQPQMPALINPLVYETPEVPISDAVGLDSGGGPALGQAPSLGTEPTMPESSGLAWDETGGGSLLEWLSSWTPDTSLMPDASSNPGQAFFDGMGNDCALVDGDELNINVAAGIANGDQQDEVEGDESNHVDP